jgi:hypothetical protein
MTIRWLPWVDPLARPEPPGGAPWEDLADEVRGRITFVDPPVAATNLGLVCNDRRNLLTRHCAMWVAAAPFDVTEADLGRVEAVRGVEILEPLTRYRFLVGIGTQFEDEEVRGRIEEALCGPRRRSRLEKLCRGLARHRHWAVLEGPPSNPDRDEPTYRCVGRRTGGEVERAVAAAGGLWGVAARG